MGLLHAKAASAQGLGTFNSCLIPSSRIASVPWGRAGGSVSQQNGHHHLECVRETWPNTYSRPSSQLGDFLLQKVRISWVSRECSRKVATPNFWSGKSLYVLVLASKFIEFPSAVIVAESNKVTHAIRWAIYGNTTLVSKRTKNNKRRNDCQKQGLKHVSSTYNTVNLTTNCLSPVLRRVSVCIRMCVHVYICACMCLHMCTGMCTQDCVCMCAYGCICMCMCIGAYTHACLY